MTFCELKKRKLRRPQSFLNNPITTKRITAPITALMIAAMTPPTRTNPTNGKNQPARTAPIIIWLVIGAVAGLAGGPNRLKSLNCHDRPSRFADTNRRLILPCHFILHKLRMN